MEYDLFFFRFCDGRLVSLWTLEVRLEIVNCRSYGFIFF